MKECFDIVFVVLVYRNTQDLVDFFKSNQISRSKTIVVCSHYNDDTDTRFSEIARINLADFIVVPNKGYGYGNNKGCEYALSNYDFKYLIISNADIKIEQFDIEDVKINNPYIVRKISHHPHRVDAPHFSFS